MSETYTHLIEYPEYPLLRRCIDCWDYGIAEATGVDALQRVAKAAIRAEMERPEVRELQASTGLSVQIVIQPLGEKHISADAWIPLGASSFGTVQSIDKDGRVYAERGDLEDPDPKITLTLVA